MKLVKKIEIELLDNEAFGRIKYVFNDIVVLKIPKKYIEDKYYRYSCIYLGYCKKICRYVGKTDENLMNYDEIFMLKPKSKSYLTQQEIKVITEKIRNENFEGEYIEELKVILDVLGYDCKIKKQTIFSKFLQNFKIKKEIKNSVQNNMNKKKYSIPDEFILLFIETKDAKAKCIFSDEGFLVLKGSKLSEKVYDSVNEGAKTKRKQAKIDKNNILQENIKFTTPSGAGSFVVGYQVSGYEYWHDNTNKKLKDILGEIKGEENEHIGIDKE